MSEFKKFSQTIKAKFDAMSLDTLFVTVDGDAVWERYLSAFPEGTNPIFRERTEHDCSCCRNFIRNLGNVVVAVNGRLESVWDATGLEYPYDVVAEQLAAFVKDSPITGLFRSKELAYGAEQSRELLGNGTVLNWNHLHGKIAQIHFSPTPDAERGNYATSVQVFERGLKELSRSSLDQVIDLIEEKAIYRGEEFLAALKQFRVFQHFYESTEENSAERNLFVWANASHPASRFRNTAIGTLIQDLSDGTELEAAVRSFEAKVAPTNYKRPTALISKGMIEEAMKTIQALDLEQSLERRFARISDVNVNDVLWVDNSVREQMKGGLKELLLSSVAAAPIDAKGAMDISVDTFVAGILPISTSLEVLVRNSMQNKFVSITAPVHESTGRLFKWANDFGWSYDGNITDSDIRRAVQSRGGRVDGVFRFSHSWNYDKRNASLMDLHVFMPGNVIPEESGINDDYGNFHRVGWNSRRHVASGGVQDVDYVQAAPEGYVPVENITFPDINKLKDGKYICKIHNWKLRGPTDAGFRAEIEFDGQIFSYEHARPLRHKEWVTVAVATLKDGKFSIEHKLASSASQQDKWGIKTESFVKVKTLMKSPNHWGHNAIGNKHWFFLLDGCKNPEPARGIYNEFLNSDLDKHRKVFEVLGSKTKCEPTEDQLSGVGFSSTLQDTVTVRVTAAKSVQLYNVKF